MAAKLAINGGKKAVSRDVKFKVWQKVTKQDEQMVLRSIRQNKHAFGPHCVKLQDEFAAWNGNKFCAATNSGTGVLHMGLVACAIIAGIRKVFANADQIKVKECK